MGDRPAVRSRAAWIDSCDQAAGRGTPLAIHCGEGGGADGQFRSAARSDDDRVVPAQLEMATSRRPTTSPALAHPAAPVAEINGAMIVEHELTDLLGAPLQRLKTPRSRSPWRRHRPGAERRAMTASGDGFHRIAADRRDQRSRPRPRPEIKGVMMPIGPAGATARSCRSRSLAIVKPYSWRKPTAKSAMSMALDPAFGFDLAGLERDQEPKVGLVGRRVWRSGGRRRRDGSRDHPPSSKRFGRSRYPLIIGDGGCPDWQWLAHGGLVEGMSEFTGYAPTRRHSRRRCWSPILKLRSKASNMAYPSFRFELTECLTPFS